MAKTVTKKLFLWTTGQIILPPLHIKFGLMKNFLKALDKKVLLPFNTCALYSLRLGLLNSRRTSSSNLRSENRVFEEFLILNDLRACEVFTSVCHDFLGKKRVQDY